MPKRIREIAIFGAGGFGLEVAMLVEQINATHPQWKVIGFFDDGEDKGKVVNGYPVLGGIDELNHWPEEIAVTLAIGIPPTKKKIVGRINNSKVFYPVLLHPSVIMGKSDYLSIGEGSIVCAGSIITTNISIGKHVILNLACTVGHQSKIGDFSSFMPNCNISGEVNIGECNFWGTGAKVVNRLNIGNNVTVGAGAVVIRDIPDDVTAVGAPARVIKKNI